MTRANHSVARTVRTAAVGALVALLVHAGHAQTPQSGPQTGPPNPPRSGGPDAPPGRRGVPAQPGGRAGAPAPAGRAGGNAAPAPPLMQRPPKAAIANVRPVRSCESLASVALPRTTIESAAIDADNPGICRVTAFTTHPPAGDRVRIWVAIPMTNWNGRFLGTGGGGFAGGSAAGVNAPVAVGFAAGATDTGHQGGNGNKPMSR